MKQLDDNQGDSQGSLSSPTEASPVLLNLEIVSYGHSNGPLHCIPGTETLTFSVRDIENPPNRLRKTHTGLSARLRKEIMSNKVAVAKLDVIRAAIQAKMTEMKQAYDFSREQDAFSADIIRPVSSKLVVGIMCEQGKHRSVTFAEELSKQIVTNGSWTVRVHHRDLGLIGDDDSADGDSENSESHSNELRKSGAKNKKRRELERKQCRPSAARFVRDVASGYEGFHD